MKNYFILPALLLALAFPAYAEEGAPPTRPHQERWDLFKQNQEERHDLFQENKEERQALLGSSTPEERRVLFLENMQQRRDLFKQNQEERRALFASTTANWKAHFEEATKEMIVRRAAHFGDVMHAMLDRLSAISDRIAARIETLKDEGKDTAEAEVALESAVWAITDAGEAVQAAEDALQAALESETPREALKNDFKPVAEAAKKAIRAAHQALMDAVKALPHEDEAE